MGLVIRKAFDWQEDLDAFDFWSIVRKSGISGKHRSELRLSLKGFLRKIFRIKKGK